MKTEERINYIKHYLGTKCKYRFKHSENDYGVFYFNTESFKIWDDRCKLLLHPLSRLTDEQRKYLYFDVIGTDNDMYGNLDEFIDWLDETEPYHLPFCIYRQLLEWHFDVFGLIEKELAESIELTNKD